MAISHKGLGEKFYFCQFSIHLTLDIKKSPFFCPLQFVRVSQSFQLDVFPTVELEIQPLWAGRVSDIVLQNYSMDWFVAYLVSGRTHALSRLSHGIRKSINS